MHKKILLAYNGSAHSAAALRQAGELAKLAGAELHILGIVVTTGGLVMAQAAGSLDVMEMERVRIEKALQEAAADLTAQGVQVVTCVRQGEPANEIIAHARKIHADLTVLGHNDKGLLARWFEGGSVGAKLLAHLPCSLLIATDR